MKRFARQAMLALCRRAGYDLLPLRSGDEPKLRDKEAALTALKRAGFSPDLIIDVGVADGTLGLYGVWPEAHLILVEPLQKFEPDLQRICGAQRSAEYRIAAAGDKAGTLQIASPPTKSYRIRPASEAPSNWTRATVPVITVDDLTAGAAHQGIVLKIDVDGPELAVLTGARRTLAETDCAVIVEAALLDQERSRYGALIELLSSFAYECFDILEPIYRTSDDALWQVDLLFVKRGSALRSVRRYE